MTVFLTYKLVVVEQRTLGGLLQVSFLAGLLAKLQKVLLFAFLTDQSLFPLLLLADDHEFSQLKAAFILVLVSEFRRGQVLLLKLEFTLFFGIALHQHLQLLL